MKIAGGSSNLSARIAVAVTLASVVYAAPGRATDPPNIIVFLADDLGISDLPYFGAPVDWAAIPNSSWSDEKGDAVHVEPTGNRWAARAYAGSSGALGKWRRDGLTSAFEVKAADWQFDTTPPSAYSVRTGTTSNSDACNSTSTSADLDTCTNAQTDALPGFGGLRALASTGVVFPRFYSNTAKCAPARAAFMTGMYPGSIGVTQNGSHLEASDVTIAEYLKQGCAASSEPIEKKCRENGQPTTCGCYSVDSDCATAGLPCYRTGLVGKWHLGDKDGAPWNQGFDEYIGFMGGSRGYWATSPLACGPVPNYCDNDDSTICSTNADCANSGSCDSRGLYVGTERGPGGSSGLSANSCAEDEGRVDPDCCLPGPGKDGTRAGNYLVDVHLGVKTGAKGQDNRSTGARPCSDTGLTKDADCSYLTRVDRDNARNFIVRNTELEPFFLVVAFHAVHVAHGAPMSTEDHYRTDIDVDSKLDVPRYPYDASRYWGSMEEMDAAVGEVLALLDEVGVCQDDPSVACNGTCTCMSLGRDEAGLLCSDDEDPDCLPPSARTAVFFVSDHGRPGGATLYGSPDFRGGKGNVFEGGIRVGLLARAPGQKKGICRDDYPPKPCDPEGPTSQCASGYCVGPGICSTATPPKACDPDATSGQCTSAGDGTCERLEVRTPVLASGVDLFPTIADLAGMGSTSLTSGGYAKIHPANGAVTNGRSFGWALLTDPTGGSVSYDRTRSFASYPGDGSTVVTHEGDSSNSGNAVCRYDSGAGNVRGVVAGSCVKPAASGSYEGCESAYCMVPGRVCLADADASSQSCAPGAKACLSRTFFQPTSRRYGFLKCRRDGDCAKSGESPALKCKSDVWIQCNGKETNTLWKLRAPSSATNADSAGIELFDLRTNPGEGDQLNCQDDPVNSGYAISIPLFNDTSNGLEKWQTCLGNSDCNGSMP